MYDWEDYVKGYRTSLASKKNYVYLGISPWIEVSWYPNYVRLLPLKSLIAYPCAVPSCVDCQRRAGTQKDARWSPPSPISLPALWCKWPVWIPPRIRALRPRASSRFLGGRSPDRPRGCPCRRIAARPGWARRGCGGRRRSRALRRCRGRRERERRERRCLSPGERENKRAQLQFCAAVSGLSGRF